MSSSKHAALVFKDFEKIYKLSGLYKGGAEQMKHQLSFIDNNLKKNLEEPFGVGASIRFDFLMTAVYFDGEEVFRAKTPEYSLSFALFYEGVKSIILQVGVTAQELFDWVARVKLVLQGGGEGEDEDLASVLWRHSSPHIKVSLYSMVGDDLSSQMDADLTKLASLEDTDEFEEAFHKEIMEGEFSESHDGGGLLKSWENRDAAWQLPSGDLVSEKLGSLGEFDARAADRLRNELADAAVSDRVRGILRFTSKEINSLRHEMESFDENQVEFNLLVHYFAVLEGGALKDSEFFNFVAESVKDLVQRIVQRFHGGLLLYVTKRIGLWRRKEELKPIFDLIVPSLKSALGEKKNLKILADAFGLEERRPVALALLDYIDKNYYQFCFHQIVEAKNLVAQKEFLAALLKKQAPLQDMIPSWGVEGVAAAIGPLAEMEWDGREQFLIRCMRNRQPQIHERALRYVARLDFKAEEAASLFLKYRPTARKIWLEALRKTERKKEWLRVLLLLCQPHILEKLHNDELPLLFDVAIRLGEARSLDALDEVIKARKLFLIPRFGLWRKEILEAALKVKTPSVHGWLKKTAAREATVIFQEASLKAQLKAVL